MRLLADFLSRVPPAEVEIATAYLCGIVPQRLGAGWAALRDATGEPASEALVELPEVSAVFDRVAAVNGKGAAAEKRRLLAELLSRLTRDEQGFLFGLLAGEVRHGALEGVMAEAVARAAQLPLEALRRAVMMAGQLPLVARAALTEGESGLARFSVQLFRPVQPMLAGSAEDESDALAELGEAALEWKLDGARIQIHKSGDDVRVYSRALNDVTAAVPEVVEMARTLAGARAHSRGRSHRSPAGWNAAPLPDDDDAVRTPARGRTSASGAADYAGPLRSPVSRRNSASR